MTVPATARQPLGQPEQVPCTQSRGRAARPAIHPVLVAMQAEPTRRWLASDLNAFHPSQRANEYLHDALVAGFVERLPDPRPGVPRGVAWRFLSTPAVRAEPLNPPLEKTYGGKVMRLVLANPGTWICRADLRAAYPGDTDDFDMRHLIRIGALKDRRNAAGHLEVQLADEKRNRTNIDRQRAERQESRLERRAAARQASRESQLAQIKRELSSTVELIRTYLRGKAEPATRDMLCAALGLGMARVQTALLSMRADGLLNECCAGGLRVAYQLVDPNLPAVPAILDSDAQRVRDLLIGRPDTELGLVKRAGLPRGDVRDALARITACGELGWSGVGNLLVYRLIPLTAEAAD